MISWRTLCFTAVQYDLDVFVYSWNAITKINFICSTVKLAYNGHRFLHSLAIIIPWFHLCMGRGLLKFMRREVFVPALTELEVLCCLRCWITYTPFNVLKIYVIWYFIIFSWSRCCKASLARNCDSTIIKARSELLLGLIHSQIVFFFHIIYSGFRTVPCYGPK